MAAGTLVVKDANNASQSLSVNQDATNSNALMGVTQIADPTTGNKANVQAWHNADGQSIGASAYGVLTSGPELLLNGAGTFDRMRSAPGTVGIQAVSADGIKATYRYAGLAFAPVATPTDIIVIQGSATTTVRVKRIKLSGVATAQGNMPAQLVRRSTAGTLGSAVLTAVTAAKHDKNDAAATAVVSTVGTANYTTLGTSAGVEATGRVGMPASGTGATGQDLVWDFSTRQDKAMILRGTSDFLCVNLNGAAIPSGGVLDYEIETEEDNS